MLSESLNDLFQTLKSFLVGLWRYYTGVYIWKNMQSFVGSCRQWHLDVSTTKNFVV